MNTRVQVEHTVTEAVTGIDIVREQIQIAAGQPISFTQAGVVLHGHAIECRINAEDASRGLPRCGRITRYREPGGIGVRVDSGVGTGDEISDLYDPLIAKLIVHDVDRERARPQCCARSTSSSSKGPDSSSVFPARSSLRRALSTAGTCSGIVESDELAKRAQELGALSHVNTRIVSTSDGGTVTRERSTVEVDGRRHEIRLHTAEPPWADAARRHMSGARASVPTRPERLPVRCKGPPRGLRRRGCFDPRRRSHLRARGDEDGERDRVPPRRRDLRAEVVLRSRSRTVSSSAS